MMWAQIQAAFTSVAKGDAKRIDGDGWTVYAVGTHVIRIDVKAA